MELKKIFQFARVTFVVCTAAAITAVLPTAVASGDIDGNYSGRSSKGLPVSFTVSGGTISDVHFKYRTTCQDGSKVLMDVKVLGSQKVRKRANKKSKIVFRDKPNSFLFYSADAEITVGGESQMNLPSAYFGGNIIGGKARGKLEANYMKYGADPEEDAWLCGGKIPIKWSAK